MRPELDLHLCLLFLTLKLNFVVILTMPSCRAVEVSSPHHPSLGV